MTLVIAKKFGNKLSLASDSRLSFGTSGSVDFGIKIFSIPVHIYSPTLSETEVTNLDYNYKYGMAVVGNAVNA